VVTVARIRLAVFDMAGTTVDDVIDGMPLVLRSYDDAFRRHGVEVPMETLNDMRGRDKREVINMLGGDKAPAIYKDFVEMLQANIGRVKEIYGTSDTFRWLRGHGVAVGVESGFPAVVTHDIVKHLCWEESGLIDYWTCSEIVDEERPSPAMIRRTMRHCHIRDPAEVVKVDDTAIGIEEGHNAKAHMVAVLTGTQRREKLEAAKPDAILPSIRELPDYLQGKGLV
jgi:phosphonoacetaldehyde hydrolase